MRQPSSYVLSGSEVSSVGLLMPRVPQSSQQVGATVVASCPSRRGDTNSGQAVRGRHCPHYHGTPFMIESKSLLKTL